MCFAPGAKCSCWLHGLLHRTCLPCCPAAKTKSFLDKVLYSYPNNLTKQKHGNLPSPSPSPRSFPFDPSIRPCPRPCPSDNRLGMSLLSQSPLPSLPRRQREVHGTPTTQRLTTTADVRAACAPRFQYFLGDVHRVDRTERHRKGGGDEVR